MGSIDMQKQQKQRELLEYLVLIRRFEERVKVLYNQGAVVGAIHLCIGQEAVATGVCRALRDEDTVFSTHRGHGHAIAKSGEVERIMAELMGRDTGLSRGHGGSMHLFEPEKGLMGGNGIVGGGIPLSLGAAFTAQYQGSDRVSVGFFSDGAVNQGTFGECLNLAALWKLPVLLVCENNQYAATTPVERSTAVRDVAGRARAYGVRAEKTDGNDVEAVHEASAAAVAALRRGEGPRLLECETYRVEPHCGIIPDERAPGERELWHPRDPVGLYAGRLQEEGVVSPADLEALERVVRERLDRAVEFAEHSPWPDPKAEPHRTWVLQ
jgi:TPP-dependent pyruvate/acetoin dehydrogenase alpha subunit